MNYIFNPSLSLFCNAELRQEANFVVVYIIYSKSISGESIHFMENGYLRL